MAKRKQTYTQSMDSLLGIKPDQLESMTRKDLAQTVTRMRDAAHKRLVRIEKSGVRSSAADYIKRSGGLAKIKGMDVTQLRNEYLRLKGFLNAKTSTVKGAREYTKRVARDITDTLNKNTPEGVNISTADLFDKLPPKIQGMMWAIIDKAGGTYRYKYNQFIAQAAESVVMTFNSQNFDGSEEAYNAAKEAAFEHFMSAVKEEYENDQEDTDQPISAFFEE